MIVQMFSVLIIALTVVGAIGCSAGSGIVEITDDTYMHSKFGSMVTFSGGAVKVYITGFQCHSS